MEEIRLRNVSISLRPEERGGARGDNEETAV